VKKKMRTTILILLCTLLAVSFEKKATTVAPLPQNQPMKITYLKKANDDLISFCTCGDGRVTFPAQISCPWCGCGWLFTCITCRKAFTFAEGVEIEGTWEEIARGDIRNKLKEEPSEEDVASWIEAMKETLANVRAGQRYVIIDGSVIHVDATNIRFEGWAAHHEFSTVPQVRALTNRAILEEQLSNRGYWSSNALPEEK
jgi:hypothetical protein